MISFILPAGFASAFAGAGAASFLAMPIIRRYSEFYPFSKGYEQVLCQSVNKPAQYEWRST
jgi:hypothetical protein